MDPPMEEQSQRWAADWAPTFWSGNLKRETQRTRQWVVRGFQRRTWSGKQPQQVVYWGWPGSPLNCWPWIWCYSEGPARPALNRQPHRCQPGRWMHRLADRSRQHCKRPQSKTDREPTPTEAGATEAEAWNKPGWLTATQCIDTVHRESDDTILKRSGVQSKMTG